MMNLEFSITLCLVMVPVTTTLDVEDFRRLISDFWKEIWVGGPYGHIMSFANTIQTNNTIISPCHTNYMSQQIYL